MTQELDFRISSGLKNIIGKELITDDLIAIFELVKNSYDANAKTVKIVFQNIKDENKNKGSRILIIDDGDGMSYDDLVKKWLFVGYSEKKSSEKEFEVSDFRNKIGEKKRLFAGAKGIGRFSCDRLGDKLDLYTKKEYEDIIHHLFMDWRKFEEDPEKEFQQIKVNYNPINDDHIEHLGTDSTKGTVLAISSLNDDIPWNQEKLIKLKRYLQRLINPTQIGDKHDFEIYLDANEYLNDDEKNKSKGDSDIINGLVKNVIFEKLDIKTAQINCSINDKGDKIYTELVDKGEFIFSLEEKNEFIKLKNINVKLFYLNRSSKATFTRIMGLEPKNFGSVFLYKNGFRIHPYGDEDDDWLGLDRRKAQGYKRYLGNRELMGRVEINGYQRQFEEVSSRAEGVIKTPAYDELTTFFVKKSLRRLERYVIEGLDWDDSEKRHKSSVDIKADSIELIKKLVGQVDDSEKELRINENLFDIVKDKQTEKLPELIKNLDHLKNSVKNPELKKEMKDQLKALRNTDKFIRKEIKEKETELKATKKTSLFLSKAVSTEKDVLINLNHSIKITTFSIEKIIEDINRKMKYLENAPEILSLIDEINLENQKIRILASYVSLANFDTKVESINKDLVLFIKEYIGTVLTKRVKNIKFKFINEDIEFNRRFLPLDISIVFDNLIDNARKANASYLVIKFDIVDEHFHIFISDNGKGIDKEDEQYLFNRGFTTTDGSGIGLYHVKQILETMEWSIGFVGNNVEGLGKGACFEVVVK